MPVRGSNYIPGKFLRGFSCSAFESVRVHRHKALRLPVRSFCSPFANTTGELLKSTRLFRAVNISVLYADRLVNIRTCYRDNFTVLSRLVKRPVAFVNLPSRVRTFVRFFSSLTSDPV